MKLIYGSEKKVILVIYSHNESQDTDWIDKVYIMAKQRQAYSVSVSM